MKILITGSTGLLGGNLSRHFAFQGHQVKALIRTTLTPALNDIPVKLCQGDLLHIDSLREAVRGVDWVIHAGAFVHIGKKNRDKLFKTNVQGTKNLCQAMLEEDVQNLIHISTVDTLEMKSLESPANEDSPQNHTNPTSHYGESKLAAEGIIDEFIKKGLHIPIILPCFMIGPWDTKPSSGQMILEISRGYARFPPSGGNNFIHVRDVCVGIEHAIYKGQSGRRYIMGHRNMTYLEAWTTIARIINAPKPVFNAPDWMIKTAAIGMDLFYKISNNEGPLNSVSTHLGLAPHYFDSTRAIKELELPQTPIEKAIAEAWSWFQANGYK